MLKWLTNIVRGRMNFRGQSEAHVPPGAVRRRKHER